MLHRAILAFILSCSCVTIFCAKEKTPTPVVQQMGDKLEGIAHSVWKHIHDHPYLTALVLWCGIYHRSAFTQLQNLGSHSWVFVPVVGTILFYLLHDQQDFFNGKFSANEQLDLNINLVSGKKEDKPK